MAILYLTAKLNSANTFEMTIWDPTAKFNFHQYFQLYGIDDGEGVVIKNDLFPS